MSLHADEVALTDPLATGLLPKNMVTGFQDHFCAKKCARGCVRQDCFCDSFDPDTMYDEATVDLMDVSQLARCGPSDRSPLQGLSEARLVFGCIDADVATEAAVSAFFFFQDLHD